jgi:hypothetical protein
MGEGESGRVGEREKGRVGEYEKTINDKHAPCTKQHAANQ